MDEKEKIQFINSVFQVESKLYENTNKEYDYSEKFWLHQFLTKPNIDDILKDNLEKVYQIALKLNKDSNS